jgi:hypothetical protein
MGDMRNANKILVGIPEGKPLGRPRHRWEDNIWQEMDFKELRHKSVKWIHL